MTYFLYGLLRWYLTALPRALVSAGCPGVRQEDVTRGRNAAERAKGRSVGTFQVCSGFDVLIRISRFQRFTRSVESVRPNLLESYAWQEQRPESERHMYVNLHANSESPPGSQSVTPSWHSQSERVSGDMADPVNPLHEKLPRFCGQQTTRTPSWDRFSSSVEAVSHCSSKKQVGLHMFGEQ